MGRSDGALGRRERRGLSMGLLNTLQAAEAARTRAAAGDETALDLVFELRGRELPADYPAALEAAVMDRLPWAADDPRFGIHPINAPLTEAGYLLSRRSRLQLRVVSSRLVDASALCGQEIEIGSSALSIGRATPRALAPFPTLRAPLVVNTRADETAFLEDIALQLELLGVKAGVLCGKAASVASRSGRLAGFALVLHDLTPAHSLTIQTLGLGGARRLGCGLFIHHKIIDGPDVWSD